MKKIISLFKRDYEGNRQVVNEVVPGAEWVIAGEGVATRKFDGTSCLFRDGKLWKRFDAKQGKKPPSGWFEAQPPNEHTGHHPGWAPVKPEDKWHLEAFNIGMASTGEIAGRYTQMVEFQEGWTYELIGPKIQGNPEKALKHILIKHGCVHLNIPRNFDGLEEFFAGTDIEGIVWWRDPTDPDSDKVKLKVKDFGLKRVSNG